MSIARASGLGAAILLVLAVLPGCGSTPPSTDAGTGIDAGGDRDSGPATDPCPEGCEVGGTCFPDGVTNPANPCEVCDRESSATTFSANEGGRCDDGAFCTVDDACVAGVCTGTARACDDGIACNGVETCNEAMHVCDAGASTCSGSAICDAVTGECVSDCAGCAIGGACYGDGQVDPADPCHVCNVATSRTDWAPADGAACDDGLFCTTGDVCAAGACTGSARDCDDGVTCDGVESCDEDADACAHGTATCGASEICDAASDACVAVCTGCVIGGVCHGEGQRNPANACEVCAPAISRIAWTIDAGGSCDDGLFCTTADACDATGACVGTARACDDGVVCTGVESCDETADRCAPGTPTCGAGEICDVASGSCVITCAGCVIGGVCHAPGALDPANPCQSCQVATSRTAWTARTGASCDDDLYCTTGETCSAAAVCGGGATRSCSDGVACNGIETCSEATDRCIEATTTCTGGRTCDTATDTCVLACVGGTTLCGSTCTNTSFDPANCGSCGTVCPPGNACYAGACSALGGVCDAFARADSTTVTGWSERVGSWEIAGGRLRNVTTGGVYSNVITRDASIQTDGCVRLTAIHDAGTPVQSVGGVLRWTSPASYVVALVQDNGSTGHFDSAWIYEYPSVTQLAMLFYDSGTTPAIEACVTGPTVRLRIDRERDGTYDSTVSGTTTVTGAGLSGVMTYASSSSSTPYADDVCWGP